MSCSKLPEEPYITPKKLLNGSRLPIDCKLAFICYCPMPVFFQQYDTGLVLRNRLFIHTHNSHVMFCRYSQTDFIVVAEVYGGPVSVTTVEELKFYGIEKIVGIGFVGAFDEKIKIGDIIKAEKALIEYGTTVHYQKMTKEGSKYAYPTDNLNIDDALPVTVWTTNALYREYVSDVESVIRYGCSVVNMDTSHLFAASETVGIKSSYFAIVSDVMIDYSPEDGPDNDKEWDNALTNAVQEGSTTESPVIMSQTKLIKSVLTKLIK